MMPNVNISSELFARIQSFAEPLVDTLETVMSKALDALAAQSGNTSNAAKVRVYNPASAPNLTFTTVHSVIVDGHRLTPAETYWNNLLRAVLKKARRHFSAEQISKQLICNHVLGQKEGGGYTYLEDVGISVQAAEANKTWKAIYILAEAIHLAVEVEFSWQDNPKAAHAGQSGKFVLQW